MCSRSRIAIVHLIYIEKYGFHQYLAPWKILESKKKKSLFLRIFTFTSHLAQLVNETADAHILYVSQKLRFVLISIDGISIKIFYLSKNRKYYNIKYSFTSLSLAFKILQK